MEDIHVKNALRLLQAAEEIKTRLSGEFSAIHGISVNEFFLLLHLERNEKNRLSRTELAKRMHVNASTITRMATPMEKLGIVEKQLDQRDARLAYVALTNAGSTKLNEAKATFAKQSGYVFQDRWDDQELDQLAELLNRIVAGSPSNLT